MGAVLVVACNQVLKELVSMLMILLVIMIYRCDMNELSLIFDCNVTRLIYNGEWMRMHDECLAKAT
jgi:hypothetical protein